MTSRHLQVCVGIDPQFNVVDEFFKQQESTFGSRSFLLKYSEAILSAVATRAKAIKFQSAYFEARGYEGSQALSEAIRKAKVRGFEVILDAKRGDIGPTMAAYGEFAFRHMNADGLTVNPFVGMSAVEGIKTWLQNDRHCYLVLLTSSGKGDVFQEGFLAQLENPDSPMSAFVSQFESCGFQKNIGIVVGAQRVDQLSEPLHDRLRKFRWLVPGIGAQGGEVSDRLRKAMHGSEVLIAVSRELSGDMGILGLGRGVTIKSWVDFEAFVSHNLTHFLAKISI